MTREWFDTTPTFTTIDEITAPVPDAWHAGPGLTWNMSDVIEAERAMRASNLSMGVVA